MITWLSAADPPEAFPPVSKALTEPAGLLAAGGDLSPARLIAAYARGIFPWFSAGEPILWWSPDPRELLFPSEFHRSRSLKAEIARGGHEWRSDTAFAEVIDACAAPRAGSGGTWITPAMRSAYLRLHALGHAHSYECWHADRLVGGVYGVRVGRVFCGESMFSRESNASKLVLSELCARSADLGISAIDCQLPNPHLRSLGSRPVPRLEFLALLPDT